MENHLNMVYAQLTMLATTYGLSVAGAVLNDADPAQAADDPSTLANADELRRRCGVPLVAHVAWNAKTLPEARLLQEAGLLD